MKKRIIALLVAFFIFVCIPSIVYWKTVMMSVVSSAFDFRYGLSIQYDKLDLDFFPGKVLLSNPRLIDSIENRVIPLASANRMDVSISTRKAIKGEVDVHRIEADNLSVEFSSKPRGELNWTRILKRIQPEPGTSAIAMDLVQNTTAPGIASAVPSATITAATTGKTTAGIIQNASTVPPAVIAVPSAVVLPATTVKPAVAEVQKASSIPARSKVTPVPVSKNGAEVKTSHLKIPVIDFQNLVLNYNNQETAETYSIRMDRFGFDPKEYLMSFSNSKAYKVGQTVPVLTIRDLKIDNALARPGTPLGLTIDTIHLNGQQTDETQYDFSYITRIWVRIYREISDTVSSRKPDSERIKTPIGELKAINVSARVIPREGAGQGILDITVNDVSYRYDRDELVLLGVTLNEGSKSLLRLDRLVLDGLARKNIQVQNLVLNGGQLDIYEDQAGGLNISRALNTILSIIDSIVPKETQTAKAKPSFFHALQTASLDDNTFIWHQKDKQPQQLSLGQLRFQAGSRLLSATDFLLIRRENEKKTVIVIPSIVASPSSSLDKKTWDQVVLNQAQLEVNWLPDKFDLIHTASDWLSLPGAVSREINRPTEETAAEPFFVRDFRVSQASVRIMDYTMEPPILHRLSNLNVQWQDVVFGEKDVPMTPFILESALSEPSAGSLAFQGKIASSGLPLNITGTATLAVQDITAFDPYFQASEKALPVRIVKGALRTSAQARITNDRVNGIIDLFLINPEFEPNQSNWPFKIDQKTVINTLNQMKNKNGVIAFPGNQWTGNIRDPKFKRGLGINDMFWVNMQGTLTTVFKLPLDIVGSVGKTIIKILGQDGK